MRSFNVNQYAVCVRYGELVFSWNQNKDETIKIVVSGGDDSLNTPLVRANSLLFSILAETCV